VVDKSLQYVYGYTLNLPDLRRKGLNRILRIIAIGLAYQLRLTKVLSHPLPEAYSNQLLKGLEFYDDPSLSSSSHPLKRLDIFDWDDSRLQSYLKCHFRRYAKRIQV
jgi:hypothetical protein